MRKISCGILVVVFLIMLTGCNKKPYEIENQATNEITVSDSSYRLAGLKIKTIEKNAHEKAKEVFLVEDEEDLVKVIQYALDNNERKISYQSESKIDLNAVAKILTYFNPYDLSLKSSSTDYSNYDGDLIYRSNEVTVENLDDRYEEALHAAKLICNEIIDNSMDNNQKITAIHDYLIRKNIYNVQAAMDSKSNPNVFKASGALQDGNAVCTGYSRAFMILAKFADVPAMYIASDTINHGWNLVYGNNGWRYIDVTWDDPVPDYPNRVERQFLNMSIDEFLTEGTHVFDEDKSSSYFLELAQNFFNKR